MSIESYMPVRLITGRGCVAAQASRLAEFGRSCLIVTGHHSAEACGALSDVTAALDSEGIRWAHFNGIGQNPKITECQAAAEAAREVQAQFIIGIGGGSPMDAAKCTAVFAANPDLSIEDLYAFRWPARPLPIVLVGTTSGTGSEVTRVSVVTTPEGRKKSFSHDRIYASLSLGDPAYTLSLDEHFTRSTAIDAFSHSMESYFLRGADSLSRTYSARGIRLLLGQFDRMRSSGACQMTYEDRELCYEASIYGGLAINKTGTGFPHAMGYFLSEEYGVPHGIACGLYLTEFYHYNRQVVPELAERFLEDIGCSEDTLLDTIARFLPPTEVHLTEADITRLHERWIGNGSLRRCQGEITADMADEWLRKLFA